MKRYSQVVGQHVSNIRLLDNSKIAREDAQCVINDLSTSVSNAMQKAAQECAEQMSVKTMNGKCYTKWWNKNCTFAKNRNRLYFYIWKCAGRPNSGQLLECYKNARKAYRKACRQAIRQKDQTRFHLMNKLAQTRNSKKLWNLIQKNKPKTEFNKNAIKLDTLVSHFAKKFSKPNDEGDLIKRTDSCVKAKYSELASAANLTLHRISTNQIRKYVLSLKSGCAPGADGLTSEHLKYAMSCDLILHISNLLSLCVTFGMVPDAFRDGVLVPILKKSSGDQSLPNSYRPITISVVLSKVLELYILDVCQCHIFSPSQYGFIPRRGTEMATALACDVIRYCLRKGLPTFLCSLDAEGAFDFIPHSVLLYKAINKVPDHCWTVMYSWYRNISVQIRWAGVTSKPIKVERGTRQCGLASPFLFNLFYQQLIDSLSDSEAGVTIGGATYNVYCYADDILLASTSASGLQCRINIAVNYVMSHGLRFNPNKTVCMIRGQNPFTSIPSWSIEGIQLALSDKLPYLGSSIDNCRGASHADMRIRAAQRAYFALQSAGLTYKGVSPDTARDIFSVGVRSTLLYGCHTVSISEANLASMDKFQSKLIKTFLGLKQHTRSTPLLQALRIQPISKTVHLHKLKLLSSCLYSNSRCETFYRYLLFSEKETPNTDTLLGRTLSTCKLYSMDLNQYLLNPKYQSYWKTPSDAHPQEGKMG